MMIGIFDTTGIMGDMLLPKPLARKSILWMLLILLIFSACSDQKTPMVDETPSPQVATVSPSPEQPTPTPVPAAVVVNGERLSLTWYESEVDRYRIAQEAAGEPIEDLDAAREVVLNDLIDQMLLAQAALSAGASVSDEDVQEKIDTLAVEVDLAAWMSTWGYTEDDLRQAFKMQLLAGYQTENIAGGIPELMEQVELQQIFAYTQTGAKNAMVSLSSGKDFKAVALVYDPVTGGYLGWVPRGYLLIPAVEEAAFSLDVGNYSEIIESEIGYHIVMMLDRGERRLSSDARLTLQKQALHSWLAEQRNVSTIEVLID